jgi:hypothetical protein
LRPSEIQMRIAYLPYTGHKVVILPFVRVYRSRSLVGAVIRSENVRDWYAPMLVSARREWYVDMHR